MNLSLQLAFLSMVVVVVTSQQACFDKSQTAPVTSKQLSDRSFPFALDIFKKVLAKPDASQPNVFISPISIWSALTMTYLGCAGKTQQELGAALNLSGLDPAVVADGYKELKDIGLGHQATPESNYTFRLANRLYFEQTVPIRLTCINDQLGSVIEKVNFVEASQPSRVQINDWVANQTNNKIKDLLPPDYVTPLTTMVIVNAAYFIGAWAHQFEPSKTLVDQDFHTESKGPIKVKMMSKDAMYNLSSNADIGASAIELPYSGGDVSMVIVLPDAGVKVEDVVAKIDSASVSKLRDGMTMTDVQLRLPKFKVQQTLELKEAVKQMGVKDLFDPTAANMTEFTDATGNYVNFIRHQTYLDVNEGGTEAAAATAVGATRFSAIIKPESVKFTVDRPFLMFIRNNKLGTILFLGCIKEPKEM